MWFDSVLPVDNIVHRKNGRDQPVNLPKKAFDLLVRLRIVPPGDGMPNGMVPREPSESMVRGICLLVRDEPGAMIRQDIVWDTVSREPGLGNHNLTLAVGDGKSSRQVMTREASSRNAISHWTWPSMITCF